MTEEQLLLETRCLSSLSKVFADGELADPPYHQGEAFQNEAYSFQVAYRANKRRKGIRIAVESDLKDHISIRKVGLAPSELPVYEDHDGHSLRTEPGLYPDPLVPYDDSEGLSVAGGQWRSIWIGIDPDGIQPAAPGRYDIKVLFTSLEGDCLGSETFSLTVLANLLPRQTLIHTEWFHSDCLAVCYGIEVFSEEHWRRIGQYVDTSVRHGMNMILTPLFTPPLDTAVGGERPTVQLVDVEKTGKDTYRFGFEKLERWVNLCHSLDVRYFEFSHLFTQWGAKHAPKIMASVNGLTERIFGWDTDASGEEYAAFLDQFLPELVAFIRQHHLEDRSYFHISDEPHLEHLESYRKAGELVKKHLAGFPIIDALSSYSFYESGLVERPIPASNHIEPFLDNRVPELWTYYCCSQYREVSNRFFAMPSARNRIIGIQLYKFQIAGFLHWGFNFWFAQFSRKAIDPFKVTDADLAFPSGDAFLVYPGEDGPIESIRLEVFQEALQDLRALQLLESLIGRERVIAMLEEELPQPITFTAYPRDAQWLLNVRSRINEAIMTYSLAKG